MKKNLMGILLVMAIAVSACGAAQPETAPVNDTTAEAPANEPARQEISLEVVAEEAPSEDTMAEEGMSADEMMEEETSADEMMGDEASADEMMEEETMDEEASADEMMEEEASTDETMAEEASTHDMADEVADAADEAMMGQDEVVEEEAMVEEEAAATTGPNWYNAELVDVSTGETFKINDFQGKVILIETMAVWCPICTQQQQQIRVLHDELGERDDLVGLSLDIDPNESPDILKAHVDRYGFNWSYAVAPPEVSREIGDLYGRNYLSPPAAPMFIIDRQGEAHTLPFGVKSAGELREAVTPFLNNEG